MWNQLKNLILLRAEQLISSRIFNVNSDSKVLKQRKLLQKRAAEIMKVTASGEIINKQYYCNEDKMIILYEIHFKYLIRQREIVYVEEEIEKRKATFISNKLLSDIELVQRFSVQEEQIVLNDLINNCNEVRSFYYNRPKAVQYAELWWNDYNPAYKKFAVDCTNYVSQCLHAGGAPMWGVGNRNKGWWMTKDNWSYSWSVAHSMRWYLATSTSGLQAVEVDEPEKLLLGDVICYDFEGDGRYDHTTIVTAKDADGMPLVNAHTYNSRKRYWSYEDSTAYTPNIKYKFYTIK